MSGLRAARFGGSAALSGHPASALRLQCEPGMIAVASEPARAEPGRQIRSASSVAIPRKLKNPTMSVTVVRMIEDD